MYDRMEYYWGPLWGGEHFMQPRRIRNQENCRNHFITHLRHIQLENDYLILKLADLINAYRPHTESSYDDHTDKRYVSKLSMKDLIKQAHELT